MAVDFQIIFIVTKGKAKLFFHAEHIGKLEETAVCQMGARLSHADNSSALIHKFFDCGGNLRIAPPFAAGMGGIGIAYVDEHINFL